MPERVSGCWYSGSLEDPFARGGHIHRTTNPHLGDSCVNALPQDRNCQMVSSVISSCIVVRRNCCRNDA